MAGKRGKECNGSRAFIEIWLVGLFLERRRNGGTSPLIWAYRSVFDGEVISLLQEGDAAIRTIGALDCNLQIMSKVPQLSKWSVMEFPRQSTYVESVN
jgi:hypothetical protein